MPPEHSHIHLQRGVYAALWQSGAADGITAPVQDEVARRFAVYRNNVQHSLTRALGARFPVIEQLVGTEFFTAMARVFIADNPPPSPVLLHWGERFPDFLDQFAPVRHLPWLGDVARLEFARGRAYHAADAVPVAPDALALADPGSLRFVLHPSVTLFASRFPAVQIWQAHQSGPPRALVTSGSDHALVARQSDLSVVVEPVEQGTYAVLETLQAGATLYQAHRQADTTTALTLLLRHRLIIATLKGAQT